MSEYLWYYGIGAEPERYYGGFSSREEAVTTGFESARSSEEDEITVVEGHYGEILTDIFDASELMEQLCEHNDEITDEDGDLGLDERTAAQERELEDDLAAVLQAWLTKHRLGRVWAFSDTRNEVTIAVPPEHPS